MEHRIRHNAPRGAIVTKTIDDNIAWSDVRNWVLVRLSEKMLNWKTCLFQGNIYLFVLVPCSYILKQIHLSRTSVFYQFSTTKIYTLSMQLSSRAFKWKGAELKNICLFRAYGGSGPVLKIYWITRWIWNITFSKCVVFRQPLKHTFVDVDTHRNIYNVTAFWTDSNTTSACNYVIRTDHPLPKGSLINMITKGTRQRWEILSGTSIFYQFSTTKIYTLCDLYFTRKSKSFY